MNGMSESLMRETLYFMSRGNQYTSRQCPWNSRYIRLSKTTCKQDGNNFFEPSLLDGYEPGLLTFTQGDLIFNYSDSGAPDYNPTFSVNIPTNVSFTPTANWGAIIQLGIWADKVSLAPEYFLFGVEVPSIPMATGQRLIFLANEDIMSFSITTTTFI